MTKEELDRLPLLEWMPSRIPLRDALATVVPSGSGEFPREKLPPGESRWYPQDDGSLRLLVPYHSQPFDTTLFHVEAGAWDHTTCDVCVARIRPMTLCYVTKFDSYIELCVRCYAEHVVKRHGLLNFVLWQVKRLTGIDGPL